MERLIKVITTDPEDKESTRKLSESWSNNAGWESWMSRITLKYSMSEVARH